MIKTENFIVLHEKDESVSFEIFFNHLRYSKNNNETNLSKVIKEPKILLTKYISCSYFITVIYFDMGMFITTIVIYTISLLLLYSIILLNL